LKYENEEINVAAEADMQEIPDDYLKKIDKQDLKDALLFLMGLNDGLKLTNS
jgi:hypothetical protein